MRAPPVVTPPGIETQQAPASWLSSAPFTHCPLYLPQELLAPPPHQLPLTRRPRCTEGLLDPRTCPPCSGLDGTNQQPQAYAKVRIYRPQSPTGPCSLSKSPFLSPSLNPLSMCLSLCLYILCVSIYRLVCQIYKSHRLSFSLSFSLTPSLYLFLSQSLSVFLSKSKTSFCISMQLSQPFFLFTCKPNHAMCVFYVCVCVCVCVCVLCV